MNERLPPGRAAPGRKSDWIIKDVAPVFNAGIKALKDAGLIPANGWEGDRDLGSKLLRNSGAPVGIVGPKADYPAPTTPISPTGTYPMKVG